MALVQRAVSVGSLAVALAAFVVPAPVRAYRTLADDPDIAFAATWSAAPVFGVSSAGVPSSLTALDLDAAVNAAVAAWSLNDCADVEIETALAGDVIPVAGDGLSTIAFVSDGWTSRGLPAGRGATTDLQLTVDDDGVVSIVEADILLNSTDYSFVATGAAGDLLDLQAVVTHEMGHALGFLHPCEVGGLGGPDCSVTPRALDSALYPQYRGDDSRTLSADDASGVCALYPADPTCIPRCGDGETCQGGRCVPAACAPGGCGPLCLPEACLIRMDCGPDEACGSGSCALGGPLAGMCVALGQRGAPCATAADCDSALCLTSARVGTYCTLGCASDADCGSTDRCAEVEGRRVCAPRTGAGCSANSGTTNTAMLQSLTLAAFWVRARRRPHLARVAT